MLPRWKERRSVPRPKESDSTEFVVCPLDVMLAYHYRMVDRARRLPYMKALNWIQTKDEADRAEWIERLRRTSLPLGRIIKQVTESRQALWEVPESPPPHPPPAVVEPQVQKRPRVEPPRAEAKYKGRSDHRHVGHHEERYQAVPRMEQGRVQRALSVWIFSCLQRTPERVAGLRDEEPPLHKLQECQARSLGGPSGGGWRPR